MKDFQSECSALMKQIRIANNKTKSEMASIMGISEATYYKFESGASSPTVPQFVQLCHELQIDTLRLLLDYLYPDIYSDVSSSSDYTDLKRAVLFFLDKNAPERFVRELFYFIAGNHGSNIYPQMQEFTMINHMPLEYRLIIARQVFMLYELAKDKGELIATGQVMPDEAAFIEGIRKGRESVKSGKNSYSEFSK